MKKAAVPVLVIGVVAFLAAYAWQSGYLGSRLELNRVLVNAPSHFDQDPAMRDAIRDMVASALDQNPAVYWSPDKTTEHGHSLELQVRDVVEVAGEQRREVLVRLIPANGDPPIDAMGFGKEPHRLVGSVEHGFRDGWTHVIWRLDLLKKPVSELLTILPTATEKRKRLFLITRLGELKALDAVEPMITLLKAEQDDDIVLRLIGTLAQIGDDRAVEAMIATTRLKDEIFMVQVVYAIGGIGGRMAEGFLVTLASGHPSPRIKNAARRMLDEGKDPAR
jgi:hypothetical protein